MFTAHNFRGKKGLSPVLQVKTPCVTIQDAAVLSICTVSRARRNPPNVSVRSRARAGDAAAEPGYGASPAADQGALAADLLIERLHSSGLPNPPTSQVLETKLIERKSTCRRR